MHRGWVREAALWPLSSLQLSMFPVSAKRTLCVWQVTLPDFRGLAEGQEVLGYSFLVVYLIHLFFALYRVPGIMPVAGQALANKTEPYAAPKGFISRTNSKKQVHRQSPGVSSERKADGALCCRITEERSLADSTRELVYKRQRTENSGSPGIHRT